MPSKRNGHCANRLFEWMTALMMLGIAGTIAASPRTIASGGFHLMQNVGLTPTLLGWLFSMGGCLRIAGLYANGHWPVYGPWARAGCALAGAGLWAQMCLALIPWSGKSGYISIGIPVYAVLALGEIISCYRAASDGRSS